MRLLILTLIFISFEGFSWENREWQEQAKHTYDVCMIELENTGSNDPIAKRQQYCEQRAVDFCRSVVSAGGSSSIPTSCHRYMGNWQPPSDSNSNLGKENSGPQKFMISEGATGEDGDGNDTNRTIASEPLPVKAPGLQSAADAMTECTQTFKQPPETCRRSVADYCSKNETAEGCAAYNRHAGFTEDPVRDDVDTPPNNSVSPNIQTLTTKYEQCRARTKLTSTCCQDPVKCIAEDMGAEDGSGYGQAAGMLQQIMTMGTMMGASGVADMCGKMKTIGNLNAVLSAGLGKSCSNQISECGETCSNLRQEVVQALEQCNAAPNACSPMDRTELTSLQNKTDNQIARCEGNSKYSTAQYSQAAASGVGAYMAGKCEDSAKGNVANQFNAEDIDAFSTNCSDPAAASNPICQNNCQRPGAENDPVCRQILGLDGNGQAGSGIAQRNPLDGVGSDADSFGLEDELEGQQDFYGGVAAQTANKADVNMQKGPGLGGGGGGGGGGAPGSAGGGGRSSASKGYNTNILKGYSGGGGYSQQMGNRYQAGGGGFSGYGGGRAKKKGNPFDLTKYLPNIGGKQGSLRNVAGLVNVNRELGKPSENIFQKMSNRFYNVCLKNRLYDCPKGK